MHNRQNAFDFVMKINLESEAYQSPDEYLRWGFFAKIFKG